MTVFPVFHGIQRTAVSTHDSCDVRTNNFFSKHLFNCSQHGFVEEGSALYDNSIACLIRISELDYFIQGIFNYGIG